MTTPVPRHTSKGVTPTHVTVKMFDEAYFETFGNYLATYQIEMMVAALNSKLDTAH